MTKWIFDKYGMSRKTDDLICPYCGKPSVFEADDGIYDCSNCTSKGEAP